MRGSFKIAVVLVGSVVPFVTANIQAAELLKPECGALEEWAPTVDPKERYTPLPGNRSWAPKAFGEPAFAQLFGKAALELTQEEVEELGTHIRNCQKAATREQRYDAQKTLKLARGMLVGRLTNVIHVAKSIAKSRKAEKAAQEKASKEPQRDTTSAPRASAQRAHDDTVSTSPTGLVKPACEPLEQWASTVDPRERYTPLPGNSTWAPKAFGDPAFAELFGKPALELTQDEVDALGAHIWDCQKTATREQRYDAQKTLNLARGMLVGRLTNVLTAAKGMAEAREVKRAAQEAHQERLAAQRRQAQRQREEAFRNYLNKLLAQADSPELLHDLALLRSDQVPSPNQWYTPFARNFTEYLSRWNKSPNDPDIAEPIDARIAELREPLLAELESQIDALPSSAAGLRTLNQILDEAWRTIGPALSESDRARIANRAANRRDSIRKDITGFTKQNIAAVPKNLKGLETLRRWRTEISQMDVTREQRSEITRAVQVHQREIADALLAKAETDFAEIPETLDGIARLNEAAETMNPARVVASESRRAAFFQTLQKRRAEIRRGALPEFEARMAALPENRQGLEQAEDWMSKTEAVPRETPMRDDSVAAAVARRDAIKAVLEEQDHERREAWIAAGGDPRLVGLRFVEPNAGMKLEFRNESRVFMNMLGIRAAGDYEVSRDDVVVNGPHGQMVLTIDGDTLRGIGLSFKRQD